MGWNSFLGWLEVWEQLSPAARRHYLEAPSHAATASPGRGCGDDLELALNLGLVERISNGRIKPTRASVPFRSLMVQLIKWPLFERKPDRAQFTDYLR